MPTLAIMFTISTYGTWLRGDARGWVDDGIVFPANPPLQAFDRAHMNHESYYFSKPDRLRVGQAIIDSLRDRLHVPTLAMRAQSWHSHFLTPETHHGMSVVAKCAKDAARWCLRIDRPIWARDYDKRYCFNARSVINRINYVERHNLKDGLARRTYTGIVDWIDPTECM